MTAPKMIGRYEVLDQIGQGGMAKALLALAPGGQKVVLKLPTFDNPEANERLRNEARIGIRLDHEGMVQTLDLFEHEGTPVLVVALIDGRSLFDLLQDGPLSVASVATVGRRVAGALKVLHACTDEAGRPLHMLHRDVTPGNILVDRQGVAKLIDLGIARSAEALVRTQTGTLLGTLPYLAPELFDDASYTTATDLWALGCVLFEAAAGERLFAGTEAQIVRKLLQDEPWDHAGWSAIDPAIGDVLRLLLQKDPSARLGDAGRAEERLLDLETRFPGGARLLGDRVQARGPVEVSDAHDWDEPTVRQTRSLYFPEDQRFEVNKHRLSTTRQWDSKASLTELRTPRPITMANLFAGATEPLLRAPSSSGTIEQVDAAASPASAGEQAPSTELLSGPKPEFAPLAAGEELTAPVSGEFISVDQLRLVPGKPLVEREAPRATTDAPIPGAPAIGAQSAGTASAGAGPAHAQSADPFAPPPVGEQLELEDHRPGRRGGAPQDGALASQAFYPEVPAQRSGLPGVVIGLTVVGALAVLIAAAALRVDKMLGVDVVEVVRGSGNDRPTTGPSKPPTIVDRIDVPDCFETDTGFFFIYTDAGGVSVVKETIEEVPRRFRRRARCVPADSK